eukprot:c54121_g1_i1 orf=148-396(+)
MPKFEVVPGLFPQLVFKRKISELRDWTSLRHALFYSAFQGTAKFWKWICRHALLENFQSSYVVCKDSLMDERFHLYCSNFFN